MELVNFADDITIFLGNITCLNRIQVILKLYEEDFSSKINFSKSQALQAVTYKNRTDKPGQMARSKLPIKMLMVNFVNSSLNNSNWNKISDSLTKNSISGTE